MSPSPSFPATPLEKLRSCQAPLLPLFENLVGGSTPPTPHGKGGAHYDIAGNDPFLTRNITQ